MLPSVISHELHEGLESFIRATFPTSTPCFKDAFDTILEGSGKQCLFQGPFLRVGLPFQLGSTGRDFFKTLETEHAPYLHQETAWDRIQASKSKSTLVATGTGSGKTECFMYPILDYVLDNPSLRGIKAIILYPMNALATDQARRFAREVYNNKACSGKVTVGLYVGGGSDGNKSMTESEVITDRDTLRKCPPDILMTNYKMLDYLLIRPDDKNLWSENTPDALKYICVDELHTFDGAQGSDLACLIRRVKARLKTPSNHICSVGTSATLGGDGGTSNMLTFAELIFGEPFDSESVVKECRLDARDHIDPEGTLEVEFFSPPDPSHSEALSPSKYDSIEEYIAAQIPLWFGEKCRRPDGSNKFKKELSGYLRSHYFLRAFLSFFRERTVVAEDEILSSLMGRYPQWDIDHLRLICNSFISLCAYARDEERATAYFLQLRSEIWMRELARMVSSVSPEPKIRYSMDLTPEEEKYHLPTIHCRECGIMGWGALQKTSEDKLIPNLESFYTAFFSRNPDPRLRFVLPVINEEHTTEPLEHLCNCCLSFFINQDGKCPSCGVAAYSKERENHDKCTIPVRSYQKTINREHCRVADTSCPQCNSTTGITIVGSRAASLTSVALSQLFGTPYNDDKKAMAFSDSVQDASHRAGFFTARTYAITLRTALYQNLNQTLSDNGNCSLESLSNDFASNLLAKLGHADFVGTFIPPSLEWMNEYEAFRKDHNLPANSQLIGMVKDRLNWEVTREFGIQCRIGRTLEKSGAAAYSFPEPELCSSASELVDFIQSLGSTFSTISEQDAKRIILGVSERLRTNGGIYHPFLKNYIEQRGSTFSFNKYNLECLPKLPRPGMDRRPTFFGTFAEKGSYERLVSTQNKRTWVETYTLKILRNSAPSLDTSFSPSLIIDKLTEIMVAHDFWKKFTICAASHEYAWALNPNKMFMQTITHHYGCNRCGHQVTIGNPVIEPWTAASCLKLNCEGQYSPIPETSRSFFADLYRKGDTARLRAAEHTGLLQREDRELIEKEFMRKIPISTDTSLLSCTPTLEMGVDVGDLSSVILCSVPPEQANYIQRVGRGGRRDGNSLALTIANNDAHDLSYYEDPMTMIAGDVQMPAIFLNAPAVLERQLTAFCIDRWVQLDPSAKIPNKMSALYTNTAAEGSDEFPHCLYKFIDADKDALLKGFLAMFCMSELDSDAATYLDSFLSGNQDDQGSLSFKIQNALSTAKIELDQLTHDRLKKTRAVAANKQIQPRDESLEEEQKTLLAERKALSRLIRSIREKQTLNFLTDEGLIPNYSFPEEGVTLHSLILKKGNDDEAKLEKLEFEHIRPAEAAITELAPGNSFYVQGRKLTVDRVSVDADDYEEWHFCKSCSHMESVSQETERRYSCILCGCTGWQDQSLRHKLLKMKQVFVTAWDRQTRSLDQKEKRELTSFNKQTTISYTLESIAKSYSIESEGLGFGFDFIDKINIRNVNLGEDRVGAESLEIGGKTLQGAGFMVCKSCGKVQSSRTREGKEHDISCINYGKPLEDTQLSTFLLYRELESEAIRLLIPSLNQEENIDTQSFVAAINLGLQAKFGGQLSHLKLAVQAQPVEGSSLKVQHVYIYDNVPGGTGYLKDLMRSPEALISVLSSAKERLEACSCANDTTVDGCYQCIKAYRFRFVSNYLSRDTALRQLNLIIDNKDSIKEQQAELALCNPLLESELERRFIKALKLKNGFQLHPQIVSGKPGYILKVNALASWHLIPQVNLGPADGVSIMSKPDFVLKPLRANKGKPIAIFLDGYEFHASDAHNRIADDLLKRNSIIRSNKYLVWSLTWQDLLEGEHPHTTIELDYNQSKLPRIQTQNVNLQSFTPWETKLFDNWTVFTDLLTDLSRDGGRALKEIKELMVKMLMNRGSISKSNHTNLIKALSNFSHIGTFDCQNAPHGEFIISSCNSSPVPLLTAWDKQFAEKKKYKGISSALWFDDLASKPKEEFEIEWRTLLASCNLSQFTDRFAAFSKSMLQDGLLTDEVDWLVDASFVEKVTTPPPNQLDEDQLDEDQLVELEVLSETAPEIAIILIPLLQEKALPWPNFGYESLSKDGHCTASMVEVAWPDLKIAIATHEDNTSDFENAQWTILKQDELSTKDLIHHFPEIK